MTDEPLLQVLRTIHDLGIEYMLTGSYASNIYGRIRSTFDADMVVALQARQMKELARSLAKDFYFDSESMREVKEAGGQFNAVHKSSGLKLDFYLLKEDAHSQLAMKRKRQQSLHGQAVWAIAPEDLILAKLRWAKSGGSARQIEDAKGVCETQKGSLDLPYLKEWAKNLSVEDLLEKIL